MYSVLMGRQGARRVMTALNVNSEKVKAIEGARVIVQKPYDMDELFATIREALN